MKYYAEIYITTARPTGRVESEEALNVENDVFMRKWDYLGEFETKDAALLHFWDIIEDDDNGFLQWK